MNDEDDADISQVPTLFYDFPEVSPGRSVQVLTCTEEDPDGVWLLGVIIDATALTDDPNGLDWLILSTEDEPLDAGRIRAILPAN